jgi:hypothetical protein
MGASSPVEYASEPISGPSSQDGGGSNHNLDWDIERAATRRNCDATQKEASEQPNNSTD